MLWKGRRLQVSVFGSSHEKQVGVEMHGFPREGVDENELQLFLNRRKGGSGVFSTARVEEDKPIFTCGFSTGKITANKIVAVLENKNVNSGDYEKLYGKPRPSHADYAVFCKDGRLDFSGGGEFSGRMTAPLCIAGGIAKQLLEKRGISVCAYVASVGNVFGKSYKTQLPSLNELKQTRQFPSLSDEQQMLDAIAAAKSEGDSLGGVAECIVFGLKAGVGGALFDGLEGKLAYLLYAIPAVKGVEFGAGFDIAEMLGSRANDQLSYLDGEIKALSNNAGGINGGISNGSELTLAVAFRPTPSISKAQRTVDLVNKTNTEIQICGRHDACIVPRALPVVEAMVALGILDNIL